MSRPYYSITIQPANEPVSYDEAAAHLRVDSEDDIDYIESLITVAREYVDGITGRSSAVTGWKVCAQSWDSLTGCSADTIRLNRSPLVSVESVKYYAPDSASLTTIDPADYRAITSMEPGVIQIIADLPSLADRPDAIQIEFTAGHDAPDETPPGLRHAIKMMVAHLYENRVPVNIGNIVSEIPFALKTLIEHQRIGGWF